MRLRGEQSGVGSYCVVGKLGPWAEVPEDYVPASVKADAAALGLTVNQLLEFAVGAQLTPWEAADLIRDSRDTHNSILRVYGLNPSNIVPFPSERVGNP